MNQTTLKITWVAAMLCLSTLTSNAQVTNSSGHNITTPSGSVGLQLRLRDNPGGDASPSIIFDSRNGGSSYLFMLRQRGNNMYWNRYTSKWQGKKEVLKINGGNGNLGMPASLGVGISDPKQRLHVRSGNLYIDNGENGKILFPRHDLTIGTVANSYNHNRIKFKPGGSSSGALQSTIYMYTANSTTSFSEKVRITTSGTSFFKGGSVGIGTGNVGSYRLAVNGKIRAKEVVVETDWSDFVFEPDYEMLTLPEVETFISKNGHLPDVPSEEEVIENGVSVGKMESTLLQKIEELTLYLIEQNKKIESLETQVELLSAQ